MFFNFPIHLLGFIQNNIQKMALKKIRWVPGSSSEQLHLSEKGAGEMDQIEGGRITCL